MIGEVVRPIRHFLLGVPGASIAGLRRVLSHPVALAQCTRFLLAHPGIEAVAVHDTAGAAREVAERGDASVAAIAASGAADRYRLDRIAADLHDRHDNQTRFLVLRRADAPGGGALPDPTSRGPSATGPWKSMLVAEMRSRRARRASHRSRSGACISPSSDRARARRTASSSSWRRT